MIPGLCGPSLPHPIRPEHAATVVFLSLDSDYVPSLILNQTKKIFKIYATKG